MSEFLQISTAVGSREEAEQLAAALVEQRLAACVQIVGPVRSVYRWQGAVEQANECLCLIKTTREQYDAIESAIRALHSYECPEIVATAIVAGAESYLSWLAAQVTRDERGEG